MTLVSVFPRVLITLAVLFQCQELNDALLPNPVRRECCQDDPFIVSEPYGDKVFLHPWKTKERRGDWYHNRAYCAENCAEMVTIHSAAENAAFHEFIRFVGMKYPGAWLGAQIEYKRNIWKWYNGIEMNYSYNAPGEFNEEGLTCLDVGWEDAHTWWRNWYCTGDVSDRHLIACQRNKTQTYGIKERK